MSITYTVKIYENHDKHASVTTPQKPFGVYVRGCENGEDSKSWLEMWDAFDTLENAKAVCAKYVS